MPTIFYWLLAILAGLLIPIQSGLNFKLGEAVKNPIYGAFLSFVVGALGLLVYAIATQTKFDLIKGAGQLPWYYWTGGLMGAFFVSTLIIVPPKLGMALTLGITVAAQLAFGLVMDHYGWLGMSAQPISWVKVVGVLLIIGGIALLRN